MSEVFAETIITNKRIIDLEEEMLKQRSTLSTERMDISIGELINLYANKELVINPAYQRVFRWSPEQKSAFIESLLLSIPVPPIFVSEDEDGLWELIDGLQRVSTLISFFGGYSQTVEDMDFEVTVDEFDDENDIEPLGFVVDKKLTNKWKLVGSPLVKNLEGFDIDTLPTKYKLNLKRAVVRVEILKGNSSETMKYELFKRLNSGGSKLTPQEIRNAIYRANSPKIYELISDLKENDKFKALAKLTDKMISEMYDQELVLRFLAYYGNVDTVNKNTENFLNDFMKQAVEFDDEKLEIYRKTFTNTMELLDSAEISDVFGTSTKSFVPAYFEGICIGLAQNIELYKSDYQLLKRKIDELKSDSGFKKASGSASNSKSRIKLRLIRADEIFKKVDGISE